MVPNVPIQNAVDIDYCRDSYVAEVQQQAATRHKNGKKTGACSNQASMQQPYISPMAMVFKNVGNGVV